jgi:hypothetical protein
VSRAVVLDTGPLGMVTLDADVILAAQARRMDAAEVVVATTNVQHLSRLVDAKLWRDVVADRD